jgi:hypothetical protein
MGMGFKKLVEDVCKARKTANPDVGGAEIEVRPLLDV